MINLKIYSNNSKEDRQGWIKGQKKKEKMHKQHRNSKMIDLNLTTMVIKLNISRSIPFKRKK